MSPSQTHQRSRRHLRVDMAEHLGTIFGVMLLFCLVWIAPSMMLRVVILATVLTTATIALLIITWLVFESRPTKDLDKEED